MTQNAFLPKFSYQTLVKVKDLPTPNDQPHTVQYRRVSPDYFTTMRIKAVDGRVFSEDDTADRPPVAIISRRFAESLMPGLDPVGRVLIRNNPPPVTIVGVPTVREADGLALSSRNVRLDAEERRLAPRLYHALRVADGLIANGATDTEAVKHAAADTRA